jgi:hypothetical protein
MHVVPSGLERIESDECHGCKQSKGISADLLMQQ